MARYLLTGGAGFIGSNLARYLLDQGQQVAILDNFSTGHRSNLASIAEQIDIYDGDLRDRETVDRCVQATDGVFHLGALGSVPRSIADPETTFRVNVEGTLNVLEAARRYGYRRVVFSGSSSAYGDQPVSPKTEEMASKPLSPYAASKVSGEAFMQSYASSFGVETVTLRYFNVFGPRQDPNGAYAAVIPAFVKSFMQGRSPIVYGDGEQTRDFCPVKNVCSANWLAMLAPSEYCDGSPCNIACGEETSLNQILDRLRSLFGSNLQAEYRPARIGDVRHSLADIRRAKDLLGYRPLLYFNEGLDSALRWYRENL